jgi:hypothetical protein
MAGDEPKLSTVVIVRRSEKAGYELRMAIAARIE